MSTTTAEVLKQARALISDEANWTRNSYARTASGEPIGPSDTAACKFCSIGALVKYSDWETAHGDMLDLLAYVMQAEVAEFNDTHTHAEVLAAFDAAISKAEGGAV